MFAKVKFEIFIAVLILIRIAFGLSVQPKWVTDFAKHIRKEIKNFQTIFINDDEYEYQINEISEIIRNVEISIPSQLISFKNATFSKARVFAEKPLYKNLQATTFFILTKSMEQSWENSSIFHSTDFLIEFSNNQIRPKCLMILFSKAERSYKEWLDYMCSKSFLDFTILEIVGDDSGNILDHTEEKVALLHYINPFTRKYTRKNFSKRTQLFPEKMRNLNGLEMKVGSFTYSPLVFVKRNESGYPVDVRGPEAMIVKFLSKWMNFKIVEVPSKEEWWGHCDCRNKNASTGIIRQLWDNNLQVLTNQGQLMLNCPQEHSGSTGSLRYCALIPILKTKNWYFSLPLNWVYLISIIVPIWLIGQILKFDTSIWSPLVIMQSLLGFTIPREPQRLAERIVLGSILIAFMALSSTVFTILTDIKLTKESELMIDTLEDLNKSRFVPTLQENFRRSMKAEKDSVIEAILNKSLIVSTTQECVEMLLQHKNVSCIFRTSTAQLAIENNKDADGRPLMKMVKEDFGFFIKSMYFEPRSPYVRTVDKILLKLTKAGLMNHWEELHSSSFIKLNHWQRDEKYESTELVTPLLFVLIIGYLISFIIFIGELLMKYLENRIYRYPFFCIQGRV